ncbi:hypothetical protein BJY01DRAFT_240860 [Aspergillus pseudoustus]|uniref:BZIP domain-containing protein n=1 Tax=Aspergillus pseudoustus TaxID=1810923 RepID=A0ABR4ILG4_9EURO
MPPKSDAQRHPRGSRGALGISERRRQQNRINQRTYRERKRLQAQLATNGDDANSKNPAVEDSDDPLEAVPPEVLQVIVEVLSQRSKAKARMFTRFSRAAYRSYVNGDPATDHMLTLAKVNVFRAFMHNLTSLGWNSRHMKRSGLSPFASLSSPPPSPAPNPVASQDTQDYSSIPSSLRPTKAQLEIPHHPWLDLFPLARMRDNLIQAARDTWEPHQLCADIMGFWGESDFVGIGLLVWGDPWDVGSWEITEEFLKKWPWVVRGCGELLDATNRWRSKRGDRLIFRYV